jgi:glycerol-3-phosphate acyltransferase PlsY
MIPEIVTPPVPLLLWAVTGYLLGSVPFGIVIARIFGLGDLRKLGSGNIGATNVLRTGNKTAALLTLILDSGKGAAAVLIARALAAEDAVQLAGVAAFLGHCFPIWLKFKGGKGVATFLGLLLAYFFPLGLAACATWAATAAIMRISSLSALTAALLAPVWAGMLGLPQAIAMTLALATLIFIRHRPNIERLIAGTEPKIGSK